ncbi:MAG TPA: ribosome recycling factor [Candidatus Saccharimonadales bacterium]|nr:ribosome recycling factor [Candidatus Saccharimonadales bacterium]
MFDTKPYETKMSGAVDHYQNELKKIRTGRAHPDMLDGILVEAYGAKVPLNQVANITVPEPQLLQVNPFDPSNVKAVVTAIREDQGLGFNPSDDGKIVRVPVPPLTEERRHQIVKQLGEKTEDARIALRATRQAAFKEAKRKKDSKELSENDVARVEKEIDKLVSDFNAQLDEIAKTKEQEILTV